MMGRNHSRFNIVKPLFIIVVCGIVGIVLTIMLNMAVSDGILSMSANSLQQFSVIILVMSLVLGTIIGVASST